MKSWHSDIGDHIDDWSTRLKPLGRGWWPRFVYHSTDIQNAVSVLENECIYSRYEASRRGLIKIDSASPSVISQTREEHKRYARLYFRPRTPTHYRSEGIRPLKERRIDHGHCPIPVYFLFNAFTVLAADETEFSTGNMATSRVAYGSDHGLFKRIPFDRVYHYGPYSPDDVLEMNFRRNAEVLIPNVLPLLPSLESIACRSAAERQTLIHLMPEEVRKSWASYIRLGVQGLFERKWTYVEEVRIVDDLIIFQFNPSAITPGPFNVVVKYRETGANTMQEREFGGPMKSLRGPISVRIKGAKRGELTLLLDDDLAFKGIVNFEVIPF